MHNVRYYQNPDGTFQLRFFDSPIFNSKPKKQEIWTDTPFWDEENQRYFRARCIYEKDEFDKKLESIRCSVSRTRKMIRYLSLGTSRWKYFCTFTFDMLEVGNRYDYDNICYYMQNFLRLNQQKYPDCQYIVVPEMHEDGAYHFHGLFSDIDVSFAGVFKGYRVYHANDFNYGFTNCTKVRDLVRVSNYITKYISKELICVSPHRKRYWYSRSTLKPVDVSKLSVLVNRSYMLDFIRDKECYINEKFFIKYIDVKVSPTQFYDFLHYCFSSFYFFNTA